MLDTSIKEIEWVRLRLEQQIKENEQLIQQKKVAFDERKQRNQKIINSSRTSPVERLRALVLSVFDSDELLQLSQLRQSLLLSMIFANSVGIFQNEVAMELNLLRSKDISQASKTEESKKYADIENELRKMKSIMDEEWKPLMDNLADEIDRRRKYLDENR